MKQFLTIFFIAALFFACNNDAESNIQEEDSGAVVDAETAPTANETMAPLSGLFHFLQEADSLFSPDFFQDFSEPVQLDTLAAAAIDDKHLAQYRPWFIFNTDSSLAIDPYSHNHVLVQKEGTSKLTGGSPDTEVALVNYNKESRQRLFYFGPSYILMDAKWKNDKTILFAVSEVIEPGKISPQIWEVDITTFTKKISYYPDTLTMAITQYTNRKIKNSRI